MEFFVDDVGVDANLPVHFQNSLTMIQYCLIGFCSILVKNRLVDVEDLFVLRSIFPC